MRIGLAGDWHGDTISATNSIGIFQTVRPGLKVVYHLGDFGVRPGTQGQQYLDAVQGAYRRAGATLYVIPGNHEDYDQIDAMDLDDDGYQVWPERPNIKLIPRGHRWELGGRSFVALGGAPSVDRWYRTPGTSWWPQEMITEDDVATVIEGGYADVMLCHDSPDGGTPAVQSIIDDPLGVQYWGKEGIGYAKIGRERMNRAYWGVKPKLFAHGHYHVGDMCEEEDGRIFLSLNEQRTRTNLALVSLDDFTIQLVDPWNL